MSERGSVPSRSAAATLLVIAAVTAAAVVGAVALLVPDPQFQTLDNVGNNSPPVTAQAAERRTDLAAPGEITLVWQAGGRIEYAGEPGVITAAPIGVTCGQAYLSVNDLPRFALCSDFPLWRPLNGSSTGSDMNVLLEFLRTGAYLGGDTASRGSIRLAILAVQKASGWPQTGVIGPDAFVWIRDAARATTPRLGIGDGVVDGDVLSEQPAALVSATLASDLGVGDWRFDPVGYPVELAIDGAGNVENLGEFEAAIQSNGLPDPLPTVIGGTVRLAEELVTLAIPAAAVIDAGGILCVYVEQDGADPTANLPIEIKIVDYRLGTAFVQGELSAGDVVLLEPQTGC